MRILQLIDSLEAGGSETMAVNLANALSYRIDKSFLCTTRSEGILTGIINERVGYFFLERKKTVDLSALFKLRLFIKKEKIKIIHAHGSSFFLAVLVKITYPKVKIIWHEHYGNRDWSSSFNKIILEICSHFFSCIIAVNKKLYKRSKEKLHAKTVYTLANYPLINPDMKITQLKGQSGKRIVCLANFKSDKDHVNLIKAFFKINKLYPEWTLHLVGRKYEDNYFKKVEQLIRHLEINKCIFIYGSRPDVFNILTQADIGVLSSKSEGLPLALLEYGLAGLPCVVTNVGDCRQVISTEKEGLLVEKENEVALSEGLIRFINDKKLRKRTGKCLSNRVSGTFSEEIVINELMKIYNLQLE